jgi:hypothetical protein
MLALNIGVTILTEAFVRYQSLVQHADTQLHQLAVAKLSGSGTCLVKGKKVRFLVYFSRAKKFLAL